MIHRVTVFWMSLAIAATACAVKSPPVPVRGSATTLQALVGRWEGEYASGETGRSGSITFALTAGGYSAFGEVIIIPRGLQQPLHGPATAA